MEDFFIIFKYLLITDFIRQPTIIMKRILQLVLIFNLMYGGLMAQEDIYPANDVRDNRPNIYLFENATIFIDHQTKIENASMLVEDGFITARGTDLSAPAGAIKVDLKGKFIYPSFIDLYSSYGLPEAKSSSFSYSSKEIITPEREGAFYVNDAIKADYNASEHFTSDEEVAEKLRKLGFGTVMTTYRDGLARGTSALVTLGKGWDNELMLLTKAANQLSFSKGSSKQTYPISIMGFMAVLRQTYYDAQWYATAKNESFTDNTLEAWIQNQSLPQFFDAPSWKNVLRADKIGDEFGVQYVVRGGGDEYQRIEEIKAANVPLIIPVNYPEAFDVEDPLDAFNVSLADMKHWEMAPANAAKLAQAGIAFSFTADGLKDQSDFLKNVRKAIKYGLSETDALKALTATPANLLNMDTQIGSLRNGAVANFIITSGNIFEEDAIIYENWIQGKPYILEDKNARDASGYYTLKVDEDTYPLEVSGKAGKNKFKLVVNDTTKVEADAIVEGELINMSYVLDKEDNMRTRLSGWFTENGMEGKGQLPNGSWVAWSASYDSAMVATKEEGAEEEGPEINTSITYPFLPFGLEEKPTTQAYLIKNATVWTNEEEGIVEETDVLVRDGKIAQIGQNLTASGATEIDGTGKHLTSGVIDEHTHIALDGVNDVATISAMVRMEDVVDSEDINIYRQLSGGVTAAQCLHGSANPVGGQSALIKFRWGNAPEDMLIKGADGFIKFALGENVKRSRNSRSIRYPQTRMGVEQVFMDGFTRAKAYDEAWANYNALTAREQAITPMPRKDLMLETMAEIINKERFISCHSYVQSEINMLMHVAEKFDFNVNTFTHILEGYKVADKMAAHGAAGSTFSDWWNYKFEVRYAIPYNAALMTMAGVTTAINSDDAEMARRLNQEAAKSIKYGGMSEEEAWKMVTLNPAKMLHLDDRMGSIKVGKDADLVLWTDNPLSIYAKAEKTMVDGIIYFDRTQEEEKRAKVEEERAILIQKMQAAKKGGSPVRMPSRSLEQFWHCNDLFFGHLAGEEK